MYIVHFVKNKALQEGRRGLSMKSVLKDVLESKRWIDDVDLLAQGFFLFLTLFLLFLDLFVQGEPTGGWQDSISEKGRARKQRWRSE